YPDSREDVLHDLSFEALPGQTTAVIGATGSGKSTLLNLIPRFFDVTSGRITLDGVDIRQLALPDLRGRIGLVPQQAQLFSGTIEHNLRFTGDGLSLEQLEEAAGIAQASDFIAQKEDGYQSEVAQDASNFSGGQKQRLSIARAIAARPEILLFDDSFSALDYRTDLKVRQALRERLGGATVLIVAQRIATVMQADKILVITEGRLAAQGTHSELMKNSPEYQQIARSQLSDEELSGEGGKRHV
ncbi:MAG TPA: ABC transporter ATP-binding protein, partial [Clostridia bacterium]|nr:ABC transporter ATP-binding protein [Clostridia bacterium]